MKVIAVDALSVFFFWENWVRSFNYLQQMFSILKYFYIIFLMHLESIADFNKK